MWLRHRLMFQVMVCSWLCPPHQYIQIMTKVLVTEKSKSRILSLTKFSYLDLTNKFECKKFKIIEFQNSMISMTTTTQLV